jgi:hypothetical protein
VTAPARVAPAATFLRTRAPGFHQAQPLPAACRRFDVHEGLEILYWARAPLLATKRRWPGMLMAAFWVACTKTRFTRRSAGSASHDKCGLLDYGSRWQKRDNEHDLSQDDLLIPSGGRTGIFRNLERCSSLEYVAQLRRRFSVSGTRMATVEVRYTGASSSWLRHEDTRIIMCTNPFSGDAGWRPV